MDKEAVFELFRERCVQKIMRSLDKSFKDEQMMFRKALTYVYSANLTQQSNQDRSLALACIYKYFVAGDQVGASNASALKSILCDLKSNCQEMNKAPDDESPTMEEKNQEKGEERNVNNSSNRKGKNKTNEGASISTSNTSRRDRISNRNMKMTPHV